MTLKEGEEFTALTSDLSRRTSALCEETYAATLEKNGTAELIARAKAHLKEFEGLVAAYDGGRRESIERAGLQTKALRRFLATLEEQQRG